MQRKHLPLIAATVAMARHASVRARMVINMRRTSG